MYWPQTILSFYWPSAITFSVSRASTFLITQTMRNISIALLAVPIPFTTDPSQFGIAFKGMGISDKIFLCYRPLTTFIPNHCSEIFRTTLDAQRARGFEIDKLHGGIFTKVARLAPMLVPVVIGSIVGAEDIISAMELRCFGVGKRSWLIELHARKIDRLLILAGSLALSLSLSSISWVFSL